MKGRRKKKTPAERLSAGRLAAASCKLWSCAAGPRALRTVPDPAPAYASLPPPVLGLEAAATPHGSPSHTASRQTDRHLQGLGVGGGTTGSHVAVP